MTSSYKLCWRETDREDRQRQRDTETNIGRERSELSRDYFGVFCGLSVIHNENLDKIFPTFLLKNMRYNFHRTSFEW